MTTTMTTLPSAFGTFELYANDRGITEIVLPTMTGGTPRPADPPTSDGGARRHLRSARDQLEAYLAGARRDFDFELAITGGTEFQRSVWRTLAEIPYGETISYAELARWVGRPQAVRAVGQANGANPLPIVLPCHRVIASGGGLGGYGGGLELKARLLELEQVSGLAALPAPVVSLSFATIRPERRGRAQTG
jgi:methylated-DNA-[protein]-cysteine S-methyltransferase